MPQIKSLYKGHKTDNLQHDREAALGRLRLSRWVSYDATCTERVDIGGLACDRNNGYGYALSVSDPDNTGNLISFSTSIIFYTATGNFLERSPLDPEQTTIAVTYTPANVTDLDTTSGSGNTNFGTFNVAVNGTGASIPSYTRFELIVAMTKPYTAFQNDARLDRNKYRCDAGPCQR